MNNNQSINNRPLTKYMIETLMDCHEREIQGLEPYDPSTLHFASGLITRGMLAPKPYVTNKGKIVTTFYVTQAGKQFLSQL